MLNVHGACTRRVSDADADGGEDELQSSEDYRNRKGDIEPGKVADIVIFDPDETYVIDKNTFFSKGRNTPFDGRKVTGKVRMTLVNGQVVYEDKEK